jgi:hypothetical protein
MPPQPDPDLFSKSFSAEPHPAEPLPPEPHPLAPDRRLWVGLAAGIAILALLIGLVHKFVPAPPRPRDAGNGSFNRNAPLMTRPQLLENQQAMPELLDFDSQNPPPDPNNGSGPLAPPGSPSTPGTSALGQ